MPGEVQQRRIKLNRVALPPQDYAAEILCVVITYVELSHPKALYTGFSSATSFT
jgi:hypothetical protein